MFIKNFEKNFLLLRRACRISLSPQVLCVEKVDLLAENNSVNIMPKVEELFRDAERLYEEALKELKAGRLRNAAENAWAATLRATDALILARTGERPFRSDVTTRRLHELRSRDERVEVLIGRYHTRADFLHGTCSYLGVCKPAEEVRRRIVETKKYIEDAKKLAYEHY
ncbi:MAG: hypothetical protein DRJ41_00965 [Thermoprotei archaeon]|nr:MAG: hypothetical protein DRJ41_00965 [Thermoprotei archaeon]